MQWVGARTELRTDGPIGSMDIARGGSGRMPGDAEFRDRILIFTIAPTHHNHPSHILFCVGRGFMLRPPIAATKRKHSVSIPSASFLR
ncbi:hypothetical protein Agabi119p4_6066 [Agaricus bisporus var. burnettii]|uniref:Uncharacterized protein n=1 Tax=Agaricus bisporus var. burnettii TaxID=192524 RepID=A0A8H7F166_AGABI|nr:hypothetical protein Agabi119p4_6066 [Agaricus bisporus var. burnettii]